MRGITAFALIIAAASLAGCERYALDRQMEELCKRDGGIKVYETVTLSPAEYEVVFNHVVKATTQEDYYGPAYRYVREQAVLIGRGNDPEKGRGLLFRWHAAIFRRSDNRLLGEYISYGRSGGDGFTFGFHPSSKSCPRLDRGLAHSVFIKGN